MIKKKCYLIWGLENFAKELMNSYLAKKIYYLIETIKCKTIFKKFKVFKASKINLLEFNILK